MVSVRSGRHRPGRTYRRRESLAIRLCWSSPRRMRCRQFMPPFRLARRHSIRRRRSRNRGQACQACGVGSRGAAPVYRASAPTRPRRRRRAQPTGRGRRRAFVRDPSSEHARHSTNPGREHRHRLFRHEELVRSPMDAIRGPVVPRPTAFGRTLPLVFSGANQVRCPAVGVGFSGSLSRSACRGRRPGRKNPLAGARGGTRCRSARLRNRTDDPRLGSHGHRNTALERQGCRSAGNQIAQATRATRGRGQQRQRAARGPSLRACATTSGGVPPANRRNRGNPALLQAGRVLPCIQELDRQDAASLEKGFRPARPSGQDRRQSAIERLGVRLLFAGSRGSRCSPQAVVGLFLKSLGEGLPCGTSPHRQGPATRFSHKTF